MDDITITNPPFVTPPAVTRAMQAELLKHLAINWPATPTGFPVDMVRAALSFGAAMLDGTAPKRRPYDILAEDFGLKLARLPGDKQVRVIGVRTSGGGQRSIWEVRVYREAGQACVQKDDEPVITIYGEKGVSPSLLEMIAVRSVLTLLVEKKRCTRTERRRRAKAKKEVQA